MIAGPGTGKTELLAQRASYLLQTGSSRPPQRILAISFKRDAATNLAARVCLRCHRDHAGRFDSLTFDAFAKGLVDRFGQALPERWRPRSDYEIMMPNYRFYGDFLQDLGDPPSSVGRRADIMALGTGTFERVHLVGQPLPIDGWSRPTVGNWAAERFWRSALHKGKKTYLSFPMIGRLAELLLRLNPLARDALRLTYSHLFMDEFQDTTQVQYDLVRTVFLGTDTVVTAVGDVKQQIMRWANAIDDPFGDPGSRIRGNSHGVDQQLSIFTGTGSGTAYSGSRPRRRRREAGIENEGTIDGESCAIWNFSSAETEATCLADHIAVSMESNDLALRDFAILVRQKAAEYADVLAPAFAERELVLRNEAGSVGSVAIQDLLSEEVSLVLIRILRVATSARAGAYWGECLQALSSLRGLDSDDDTAQTFLSRELDDFARRFRCAHSDPLCGEDQARRVVAAVQSFVGRDRLIASHPAYRQGDWFDKVTEAAIKHLCSSAVDAHDWPETLDTYEGKYAVPLMTIHKSKGLEYHTVIFVGLDDSAWWSFTNDPVEGTAGFFVAFSRAKQRVVFTYCARRGRRAKIAPLYELLQSAGIESQNLA